MKNIPEWNKKLPYWEQEKSTLQFFKEEWYKINHGITIGGIHIHPWLYFHLNYFKTPIPQPDKTEKIMNPPLRDNEWYFMENYQAAEDLDKVLMLFGTRRYSKSSIISSVLSHLATTKENGKSEVIGGSDPDLKQLSGLIKIGMINMHPAFKLPSNTQDWNSHIKLGVKHKSNEEIPYSEIIIKNAVDGIGKASEKGAGGSPVGWVLDECGKFGFIPFLQSALPAFKTIHGMKLVPILTGTSGNVELSKDAATVLSDPTTYNIMPMDWDRLENKVPDITDITWKRSTFGVFVPAQMTGESGLIKIENNLAGYLKVEDKELKKINIQTTDWSNAKKVLHEELIKVKKDADATNKRKMYYPTCTEDCFISNVNSPFPSNDARLHRQKLIEEGNIGRNVDIFDKGSGILGYEFSEKQRAQYPFKGGMCNAPVIFFDDPPIIKPSYGEFVGGLDGYKQALSGTDSVGTLYILQRRFNLSTPIEIIKCSYAARPSTMIAFNRNCELMIEGWGAETLIENVDTAFIEYLKSKNKAEMLLADGVEFSKLINPNSKPSNNLGIYPSVKNQAYLLSLAADYCNEEVVIGYEDDGTPITKLGVYFIPDVDLLEEIIDFKYDENHDRLTAFSLALGWARELDRRRIIPREKNIDDAIRKKNIKDAKMMSKGFVNIKRKKESINY
jgi:hypothetical protein